jgi:processive 1,2-diacylglycerol beta-glucosyltransferase
MPAESAKGHFMGGILILSAQVGAGHVRAAQAIEQAFAEIGCDQPVHHVETLEYANPLFRRFYSKAYIDIVSNVPELFGWYYDRRERWNENASLKLAFDKLNTRPFIKLLERYQPEVTVCTHPMPAAIVSWLIEQGRLSTRQAVVVTDFDIHVQWLCPNSVHYFVAIDEARAHLQAMGIPANEITVSGIPIDPAFSRPRDPELTRQQLGLRRDATVILISAGGFGVGRIDELISSLLRMERPTQVVAICGQNEELKSRLEQMAAGTVADTNMSIHIVGYTNQMDDYMAASDFVVGKPGGLTMSEALACDQVFVVVSPIPGQEERNADHLLEEGAAIRCNNLPVLAYKIERLLDNPQRLAWMRKNVRRLARPRAAFDIVAKLQSLEPQTCCPRTENPS